nr:PREDICTED: membrane-spanning 4-domains subfamily A member 8 [Anolis carolinensis]|eukprot:XP_016851047.1 PREDICTED: membrane-spanning 4-domains subfamily A member 8 [Anolis carolinensis]
MNSSQLLSFPEIEIIYSNVCLFQVKSSVGMNIVSAIMALTGSLLLLVDLLMVNLSSYSYDHDHYYECYLGRTILTGSSAVLLLFSFLEFGITISTAHFGCQAACCPSNQQPMVFVPYTVSGGVVAPGEGHHPPPPAYNPEDPSPK